MTIRPIYLVSVTPPNEPGITHLPLLGPQWLYPSIDFSAADGIILTSKTGADALEQIDPAWKTHPVICVGKATRRRAEELGAVILATGDGYGDGLLELIRARYAGKRWLYARPKVAASDFARQLSDAGIVVNEAVVYETVCKAKETDMPPIETDAVLVFTSPSALKCFQTRADILPSHSVVVIGHTTEKSLPDHPVHIAPEPTVAACIALAKQLAKEPE